MARSDSDSSSFHTVAPSIDESVEFSKGPRQRVKCSTKARKQEPGLAQLAAYQQQPLYAGANHTGLYADLVFMSSTFQIGFQFWAIRVGILHIGESPAMIAHHVTVVAVSAMSGFLRNGFRYWTPFFYGMIEASSLFLSVMSYCNDNPHWIESHPRAYAVLRLLFVAGLLCLRVIMFTPRLFTYASHQYWLFLQHPSTPYQPFMGLSWLSSSFLLLLQWYWATLIVRGLMKQIVIRGKEL